MSASLRVLAPEELGLVAGGSLDTSLDPNWMPGGSAYSGMGLNVPVFSATTWTTSGFGNNYENYAQLASNSGYASANAFLMANPYTYTPPTGEPYVPVVKFVDNNNTDFSSQNGTMVNGVYKAQNPYTGNLEVVVKADVSAIVVSASFQADPSWTNFSNLAGLVGYSVQNDYLAMCSVAEALAKLTQAAQAFADLDTNNDGTDDIDVKAGVDPHQLSSQMKATFDEVVSAWATHASGVKPVITSTFDSTQHTAGSKHYIHQAMDIRGNNINNATGEALAATLQQTLGSNYWVDFEIFPNEPERDHIHIQYNGS